jgi:trehalose/maltose hydrolase-like predicted phosphorylase
VIGDSTFQAIVCRSGFVGAADRRAHADDVTTRIEALRAAGVHVFVVDDAADSSRSACGVAAWLAERGITGNLILVVGDEFGAIGSAVGRDSVLLVPQLARARVVSVGAEPGGAPPGVEHLGGGPDRLLELLDLQLARRISRRVPWIDEDPDWVVPLPDDPAMARAAEAIGTLSNGWAAVRGSREEGGTGSSPSFAVNGIYTHDPIPRLLPGPVWTQLTVHGGRPDRRVLDLRTGMLVRESTDATALRSVRFVSAARRSALALRAEAAPLALEPGEPAVSEADGAVLDHERRDDARLVRSRDPAGGGGIGVAIRDRCAAVEDRQLVERIGAWVADAEHPPRWDTVADALAEVDAIGFDQLAAEHRSAWAQRWSDANVTIDGDPEAQLAVRFALFHLLSAAPDEGEAAVGARGLTGPAYGGHVFWDADVYVLPALAALRPAAARAMLEYRIRRLPEARAAARTQRRRGARFPWESAHDGTDVTPPDALGRGGERIPIRTGPREEHIVADIAWAAGEYAAWSGDHDFLVGAGRNLLVDTARYWASRVRIDAGGRGHIDGVMGPDEYHEVVDDNAFTNVMARWNLRRAAQLVEADHGVGVAAVAEAADWRRSAEALVDGWDPSRRLHEQFAGYWELEPLLIAAVAAPPIAVDVLLGPDRVRGSQLIKQADVLMLHHLVPDEVEPGSLATDLAFYEPRTAHGSSLSPAIHASLLARAGRPDDALQLFRLAARLDLDDVTGTTAGGLHLATMGGIWQALAYGFLGLRPGRDALGIDPCLPTSWAALELRLRVGGHPVSVHAERSTVTVTCDEPLAVRIGCRPPTVCSSPGQTFALGDEQT